MMLDGKTRLRARATLPLAIACIVFAAACSDDSSTTGSGGSGGTGGATGGAGGEGGAAGSATGGSAGSGATGGSAGSGTGGAAGSGATGGSAGSGATGGSAGSGATGGSAGSGGATGGTAGAGGSGGGGDGGTPDSKMNFFVTSDVNKTGNLGGLTGADARCQKLAAAVGQGNKTWRAYLSTEVLDAGGTAVNAKDRIGPGPYYNSKGVLMAADSAALHAMSGNADLFIDENGQKIKGQWTGSGTPVEHDVLTGSTNEGTVLVGKTCINWTSEMTGITAQVGHSDGLGPSMNPAPPYNSWQSSHENGGCNDTAPRGGAGRLYCFVGP